MEVSCQPHTAVTFALGESPLYPLSRRWGGPQRWSGHFGEEINFLPQWDSNPRLSSLWLNHYTDDAIPGTQYLLDCNNTNLQQLCHHLYFFLFTVSITTKQSYPLYFLFILLFFVEFILLVKRVEWITRSTCY
jgi:hypothetical protein